MISGQDKWLVLVAGFQVLFSFYIVTSDFIEDKTVSQCGKVAFNCVNGNLSARGRHSVRDTLCGAKSFPNGKIVA